MRTALKQAPAPKSAWVVSVTVMVSTLVLGPVSVGQTFSGQRLLWAGPTGLAMRETTVAAARNNSNRLVAAWMTNEEEADDKIHYSLSSDGGASWSSAIAFQEGGVDLTNALDPYVALDPSGNAVAVCLHPDGSGGGESLGVLGLQGLRRYRVP